MAKDADVAKEVKAEIKQKIKQEEKKKEIAEVKKEVAAPAKAGEAKKEIAKEAVKAEKKEEKKGEKVEEKKEEKKEAKKEEAPLEEKKYTFSLRAAWRAPRPERARAAIKNLKAQLERHLKKPVKLDVSINKKIWQRGITSPPRKIKVIAKVFKDFVRVFAE